MLKVRPLLLIPVALAVAAAYPAKAAAGFTPTGAMKEARWLHTATLLNNGTVLVTGGSSNTAEIYDPAQGTWRYTIHPMNSSRSQHTAVKLADGRVLIAGGTPSPGTGEVFDPTTEQFTPTNPMNGVHMPSPGILFNDGRVLVLTGSLGFFGPGVSEIYDPSTNSWATTPAIPIGVSGMAGVKLSDGTALALGGYDGFTRTAYPYVGRYTPATNAVMAMANMVISRLYHTATLLPNGTVLIAAGTDPSYSVSSTEIYDPTVLPNGQSQLSTSLNQNRRAHTATLLSNGDVLVTGGFQAPHGGAVDAYLATAELRDHSTGLWSLSGTMSTPRSGHTATLLNSGAVLVAGGGTTAPTNSVDLWNSSYNAVSDFSISANPNTAWSYGYTNTLGGAFGLHTIAQIDYMPGINQPGVDRWTSPTVQGSLGVMHNKTGSAIQASTYTTAVRLQVE